MKRHPFNLIELMLALGVIVVGLVSVMALFPVGASANRDAMAENCSAQAAEQMLNTLAFAMRSSNGNWGDAIDTATATTIPKQGSASATQTMIEGQADYFPDGDVCSFLAAGTDTIYWRTSDDYSKGFRIQNAGGTSAGVDLVDFEAMVALWHEPIELGGVDHPEISVTLHLEISWPARIAYEQRRKAKYSLRVFNPNH